MARKIPSLLGLALTGLLKANGWTAKELAAKAGVAQSTMSVYESGDVTRERLEELAALMALGPEEVERAVFAASLLLPPPLPRTPVDPTEEEWRVIIRAAATAGRDVAERVRDDLLREVREEKAALALQEGEGLYRLLKPYSETARRDLIENASDYQHWGLAVHLCRRSETAAADKPGEALKLAELAVFVARRIKPDTEIPAAWLARLEGWCTAFLGNAQKAANDVPLAAATFARALHLWHQGEDEAGLLSEAYLLDLEASLRRAQGLFPLALELHDKARKTARPEELGVILVNKAVTFQEKGDPEKALPILEEAAQVIDGERQPRLRFGLRFNQAASLCLLGRAEEAAPIVDEVRRLAEGLRNDVDLVKTVWLRGNLDAGLGKRKEALEALEQVRRDFEDRTLPFDYALASLDVALLYRVEGRFPEIKALAQEILQIFRAQGVHREAIGAVILFQDAAEKEQVTPALVRRLQDYLSKARSDPKLRFKA